MPTGRISIALLVVLSRAAVAQAIPDRALTSGTLAFDAKASLGAFTGTTTTTTGALIGAPTLARVRGWVEAPSKSLTTNNGHRDNDMAGSLEIAKYPVIRFDLDSVATGDRQGDSTAATLAGSFTLHGQKRAARIPGWVWLTPQGARFRGVLPINVKDYGVGGLSKFLGMFKMNEMIAVRMDVTFGEK
jgi:polyisoprenoid-binding protein YceI